VERHADTYYQSSIEMNYFSKLLNRNWIATVLTPIVVILMEVFWFYAWLTWIGKWQILDVEKPSLSLISCILLMGISFFSTRFFLSRKGHNWINIVSIIAIGLLAVFIVVRIEYSFGYGFFDGQWFIHTGRIILDTFSQVHHLVIVFPAGVYLWWRGIYYGRSPFHSGTIYRSFIFGIAALIFLIIVWSLTADSFSVENLALSVGPYIAFYFFFGLLALALSNLQSIQERILSPELAKNYNRRWLPVLLGIVAAIIIVGVGLASVFSPDFIETLTRLFKPVVEIARLVIHYILIPLGFIVEGLFYVFRFFINLIRSDEPLEPFEFGEQGEQEEMPEAGSLVIPDAIMTSLKWTLFAILAIIVIFFIVRALARYRQSRKDTDVEEFHESLWSWAGFREDLRLFLNNLLRRFQPQKKAAVSMNRITDWDTDTDAEDSLDIREIYRRLLLAGNSIGVSRNEHETPDEYKARLQQALPEGNDQFDELTGMYSEVRYGDTEMKDPQTSLANRFWRILKDLFKKQETGADSAGKPEASMNNPV